MSCEIIQFSAAARPARKRHADADVAAAVDRALTERDRVHAYTKAAAARRKAGAPAAGNRDREKCADQDRASRCVVACPADSALLAGACRLGGCT